PALLALLAALERGERPLPPALVGGVCDRELAGAPAIARALEPPALLLGRSLGRGLLAARCTARLGARGDGLRGGGVDHLLLLLRRGLRLRGGSPSRFRGALLGLGCLALRPDLGLALGALRRFLLGPEACHLGLAFGLGRLLGAQALRLLGPRRLDRLQPPLDLGFGQALQHARFRLPATVTHWVRPWRKLWRT